MAVMVDADRFEAFAEIMRDLSADRESTSILKPDLRAAVDAIDQWISDNAASFNTAIPQPARTNLTASQKARLLMNVVRKRYAKGT